MRKSIRIYKTVSASHLLPCPLHDLAILSGCLGEETPDCGGTKKDSRIIYDTTAQHQRVFTGKLPKEAHSLER